MKPESISPEQACRLVLHAQLLGTGAGLPAAKEGVAQAIERLGYVQIDSIAVIQRAQHHTLWTRCPDYEPGMLYELQADDRRVFEYWGHALSYLPLSDYRYYLPRMQTMHDPKSKWEKGRLQKYGHLAPPMLERIRLEGPLSSKDFGSPPQTPVQEKDMAPPRAQIRFALELLLLRGDVMVTERRKNLRVYDLTERVLPDWVDTRLPAGDELGRFFVCRALSAYGIANVGEIRAHIDAVDRPGVEAALCDLVAAGQVVPVQIEGTDGPQDYALADSLDGVGGLEPLPPRVWLLSPFDNLVIQRGRIRRLFGFEYALECYVSPAKRKYGYFVLPVLWGERLVARLDPKADRKGQRLIIRNLVFEPGCASFDACLPPLATSLVALARFNGCEAVVLERVLPDHARSGLTACLREGGM